jgi:glycolate oxidase FAD binding subunit
VLPRPVAEQTLAFELDEAAAIRQLNEWGGQPLPISASAWCDGELHLRLSGARAAVEAARKHLGGRTIDGAERSWSDLREQRHPFFAGSAPLWRMAVPPTVPPLELGATLIEWHGGQRWIRSEHAAAALHTVASGLGGHATRFRGGDPAVAAFQPLEPALARIHARLKAEFDPAGIFNPGRLLPA